MVLFGSEVRRALVGLMPPIPMSWEGRTARTAQNDLYEFGKYKTANHSHILTDTWKTQLMQHVKQRNRYGIPTNTRLNVGLIPWMMDPMSSSLGEGLQECSGTEWVTPLISMQQPPPFKVSSSHPPSATDPGGLLIFIESCFISCGTYIP